MSMEADVRTILENVKSFRNDQFSMKKDGIDVIRAEVLAISKDLHAIKRESGLDKLRRIEAELEGYDFEKAEKLYPEVNVRAALAAILEILAE